MNATSLDRLSSKNQGSFPAQEVEKHFKIKRFYANRAYKEAKDNRHLGIFLMSRAALSRCRPTARA